MKQPLKLRQAARLSRPAAGRRHQVSLGAQSAFASRHAGAGLCAQPRRAISPGDPAAPGELVRILPVPNGTQLVKRARTGDQADQLVGHVATPRRSALAAVRRRGRCAAAATLAGIRSTSMRSLCGVTSRSTPRPTTTSSAKRAAGLFIARLTWPHWPARAPWLLAAKAILEREALLQNAPDGVNREQAVSYQQFELDLLLLTLLAGRANGQWFSVAYESRVAAMLEYLASIMDAGGNVPMFGDSDDGLVVGKLAQGGDFCRYRSLLASGAIVFRSRGLQAQGRRPRRQDALAPGRASRFAV